MILRRPRLAALFTLALFPAPGPAQEAEVLRLQPGDAVRLEVGDEREMGGDYVVGEDGRVLLPLVGFVDVGGRPFADVLRAVREAYATEVKDASVALTPVMRIAVLGEVRNPGLVPADPTLGLAEIVASAGGLAPEADPGRVTVLRGGESLAFGLDDGSSAAYRLRSGDQIVVGRRSWVSLNRGLLLSATTSVVTAVLTALILR